MKLVCLIVLFMITKAGAILDDTPRTFCGRHLANARLLYCYGLSENTRKRFNIKTSQIIELLRPEKTDYPRYQGQNIWSPSVSGIFGAVIMTKRFGIVDECCLKPCYIRDLLSYC